MLKYMYTVHLLHMYYTQKTTHIKKACIGELHVDYMT